MNKFSDLRILLVVMGLFYLMFPQSVHAYLDPGTGSIVLQIIIAAVVGLAFTIKLYWAKLRRLFVNRPESNAQEEDDEQ